MRAEKTPHRHDGVKVLLQLHRSSFSTLPYGRLLCGQRACLSRTLYGSLILTEMILNVNNKESRHYCRDCSLRLHCAAWGSFLLRVSSGAGGSPFHILYVPGGRKGDRKLPIFNITNKLEFCNIKEFSISLVLRDIL